MKHTILWRGVTPSQALEDAVESRLKKLDKFFPEEASAHALLSITKDEHRAEITVSSGSTLFRSEQSSGDMYVSIDLAGEVLERQVRKYRNRITDRRQNKGETLRRFIIDDENDNEEVTIVRRKRFDIAAQYPEDACMEMDLLEHTFHLFINAETGKPAVVYRRADGAYGMIEGN